MRAAPAWRAGARMSAGDDIRPDSIASASELSLADIPEAELTPRVRDVLFPMSAEVQKLRAALSAAQGRVHELEGLANRDPLLDILNRRAFMEELERAAAMVERYGVQACLAFIDLNDLKKINDERGHMAGDAALKHIAGVLSANVRQTDVVGRLGGDEFGLILGHVTEALAERKAAQLAGLIGKTPVEGEDVIFSVRISYGVAAIEKGATPAQAIEHADRAMYRRKRANALERDEAS